MTNGKYTISKTSNARPDLILTEEGRVRVTDVDNPDGIDLLETIRDLTRRIEELERAQS